MTETETSALLEHTNVAFGQVCKMIEDMACEVDLKRRVEFHRNDAAWLQTNIVTMTNVVLNLAAIHAAVEIGRSHGWKDPNQTR